MFHVKILYDLEMHFMYSLLGDLMLSEIKAEIKIILEQSYDMLSVFFEYFINIGIFYKRERK